MYLPKYPKFKKNSECKYPERDNCNYDEKQKRCEFMKYDNSKSIFDSTRWRCTYNQGSELNKVPQTIESIKKEENK